MMTRKATRKQYTNGSLCRGRPAGQWYQAGPVAEAFKGTPLRVPSRVISFGFCVLEPLLLLVPVCLSATHVAYGALRMEPQYINFGHAAGVAAVAAIRAAAAVQDIDVKALQARLLATRQVLSLQP